MPFVIVRENRIGLQKFGTDPDAWIQRIFDDKDPFAECFYKDVFAYPLGETTSRPDFDSFCHNLIPSYRGDFILSPCPFLTITPDGRVRMISYFKNREINDGKISWLMTDLSRKNRGGYVLGEGAGEKEVLTGIIASGVDESSISEYARLVRIDSQQPFIWFDIDHLAAEIKTRSSRSS